MYDPENICRSCLVTDVELLPLNVTLESGTRVDECFRLHMHVDLSEDDGLPYNICIECLHKMVEFRTFYSRYLESEAYLMQFYMNASCQRLELDQLEEAEVAADCEEKPDIKFIHENDTVIKKKVPEHCSQIDIQVKTEEYLETETLDCEEEVSRREEVNTNFVSDANYSNDAGPTENTHRKKESKLIYCLQCHRRFPTRYTVRQHFDTVHGEDNRNGYCTQCSKTFPTRGQLLVHLHTHFHPATLVKCSYCDKTFHKSKLEAHKRTHTGVRPFACTICGRAFSQRSILNTHMKLHTGKTISCPKCDKKFCRKGFLDVHMRVHDDVRPYECTLCDNKYRIKSHLNSHMLTHSDIRKFSCHVCGKTFREKCTLTSHLNTHTKPYKCPKCPLRAAKLYIFRKHLTKMHDIHDDPKLYKVDT